MSDQTQEFEMISVEKLGDVFVLKFRDEQIFDPEKIETLNSELLTFQENQKVVISFEGVKFIASQVVAKLLVLIKRLKSNMKLCNMGEEVANMFTLTNLDKVFQIFESLDQAIDSY